MAHGNLHRASNYTSGTADQEMTEDIRSEIKIFITANYLFGRPDAPLGDDQSFLEGGIIDSTGFLELVGFIEERYGISVEDKELLPENLDSLRKVSQYVARKRGVASN